MVDGQTADRTEETMFICRHDAARRLIALGLAALAGTLSMAAEAQTPAGYPNKTIRFVVPYAAGGLPDTVARVIAQRLQEMVGQPVVVENRPGANGAVAAIALSTNAADGYTFLGTDGSMFSINPKLYSKLGYNATQDFVPVALVARAPLFLATNPKLPVGSLKEFVTYVKANPGKVSYGSSGIGSTHQLTMEALKSELGLDMTHIPFEGSGQSVPALIGGQVEVLWSAYPSLAGFVKDSKVKILATNGAKRSTQAPDVPAVAEQIPGFDFAPIIGVLAPKGTPKATETKRMQFTTYADTGAYTAEAALADPALPGQFNVAGDSLTFHELVNETAAALGRPITVKKLGTLADLDAEIARRQRAEPDNVFAWLPLMYWRGMLSGKGQLGPLMNADYPTIHPMTVRKYVKQMRVGEA